MCIYIYVCICMYVCVVELKLVQCLPFVLKIGPFFVLKIVFSLQKEKDFSKKNKIKQNNDKGCVKTGPICCAT